MNALSQSPTRLDLVVLTSRKETYVEGTYVSLVTGYTIV
jgi:hypothetical protein